MDGLLQAESEPGTCRVICYSPRHDLDLASMSPAAIRPVVDLWSSQVAELAEQNTWVQVFENRGATMGASNPHPHGQIWAGAALPNEPLKEDREQRRYFEKHGSLLLLDYIQQEADGDRVVAITESWVALVPFWAVWPFELLLVPRRPVRWLPELLPEERDDLAERAVGSSRPVRQGVRYPIPVLDGLARCTGTGFRQSALAAARPLLPSAAALGQCA